MSIHEIERWTMRLRRVLVTTNAVSIDYSFMVYDYDDKISRNYKWSIWISETHTHVNFDRFSEVKAYIKSIERSINNADN